MKYDQQRAAYLEGEEFRVIRISNRDAMERFSGVCECIHAAVQDRMEQE